MPSFAKLSLLGHVGRVEKKELSSGSVVLNYSIAVSNYGKEGDKYVDKGTTWINCSYFNPNGYILGIMEKGILVYSVGKLEVQRGMDGKDYIKVLVSELVPIKMKDASSGKVEVSKVESASSLVGETVEEKLSGFPF